MHDAANSTATAPTRIARDTAGGIPPDAHHRLGARPSRRSRRTSPSVWISAVRNPAPLRRPGRSGAVRPIEVDLLAVLVGERQVDVGAPAVEVVAAVVVVAVAVDLADRPFVSTKNVYVPAALEDQRRVAADRRRSQAAHGVVVALAGDQPQRDRADAHRQHHHALASRIVRAGAIDCRITPPAAGRPARSDRQVVPRRLARGPARAVELAGADDGPAFAGEPLGEGPGVADREPQVEAAVGQVDGCPSRRRGRRPAAQSAA